MQSFTYHNPTKIIFGEKSVERLHKELAAYGKTVLLTYGGGSIKANGIYDSVIAELEKAGKRVVELSGIMSNPRTTKVQEGIDICRREGVDFILAVGGGSVIDCSKFIAGGACLPEDDDFWQRFFINAEPVTKALPLGVVLTMSATGSEMNRGGVITNWETKQKLSAYGTPLYPKFSILDPKYTYSLPKEQVCYGVVDSLSHLMEQYFCKDDEDNVSDALIETVFKTIMAAGHRMIIEGKYEDYTARSNFMWSATLALNGMLALGKTGDWITHQLEHALSAFYDIPHGAGLSIVHPNFLYYIYKDHLPRFVRFAKNVWAVDTTGKSDEEVALEGLVRLRQFFTSIGAPATLGEVNIPESSIAEIAASCNRFPTSYTDLGNEDFEAIYRLCLSDFTK